MRKQMTSFFYETFIGVFLVLTVFQSCETKQIFATKNHICLHDLRHSCASNMLANGVPMKEIQEWLGHSNFSTTADIYSHLDFGAKVREANIISSAYETPKTPKTDDAVTTTQQNSIDLFLNALSEMKRLGFERLEDYLTYLQTNK